MLKYRKQYKNNLRKHVFPKTRAHLSGIPMSNGICYSDYWGYGYRV